MQADILAYGNLVCGPEWRSFDDGGMFHKVYYVKNGAAFYRDDMTEAHLVPGTLYLLPMHKKYKITHDPKNPFDVLWLHLDCYKPLTFSVTGLCVRDDMIESRLLRVVAESMTKHTYLLSSLASALLEAMAHSANLSLQIDKRISDTVRWMYENMDADNASLAKRTGYNKNYFIHLFRDQIGVTPHRYLLQIRMNRAKKLLMTGESVCKIAEQLKYNDINAFSRDFRRYCGISPSQYRHDNVRP